MFSLLVESLYDYTFVNFVPYMKEIIEGAISRIETNAVIFIISFAKCVTCVNINMPAVSTISPDHVDAVIHAVV